MSYISVTNHVPVSYYPYQSYKATLYNIQKSYPSYAYIAYIKNCDFIECDYHFFQVYKVGRTFSRTFKKAIVLDIKYLPCKQVGIFPIRMA